MVAGAVGLSAFVQPLPAFHARTARAQHALAVQHQHVSSPTMSEELPARKHAGVTSMSSAPARRAPPGTRAPGAGGRGLIRKATTPRSTVARKLTDKPGARDPLWPTARFTRNAVQLTMEWLQKNKPQSFPPVFTDHQVDTAPVRQEGDHSEAVADASNGQSQFFTEIEVAGMGKARGSVATKKQEAKELACQAWLTAHLGRHRILANGWLSIAVDSPETASELEREVYNMTAAGRWRQALQLCAAVRVALADAIARGAATDNALAYPVFEATMAALSKGGHAKEALQLLDEMRDGQVPCAAKAYNMAMTACERGGEWQRVPALVARMRAAGVEPDIVSYNCLISALGSGGQWERAVGVLEEMRAAGLQPDIYSYSSAIGACERCHRWREAMALLDDMRAAGVAPNDYAYSGVIRACAKGRDWRAAMAVLERMEGEGCPPTIFCYNGVISALGEAGQWESAVALLDTMRERGVPPSVVNHNAAIDACAKAGQWQRAVEVFRGISEAGLLPDLVSYNTVLGALRVAGQVDLVVEIFQELRLRGNLKGAAALRPDRFTCSCVVKALTGAGRPDLALKAFDTMRREGIRVDTVAFNTAIGACGASGEWERALMYLQEMEREACPDKFTYNTLISVMDASGQGNRAVALLEEMRSVGLAPDQFSYNAAISACRHLNLRGREGWDQAIALMKRMELEGVSSPTLVTYNTAMLVAGRAGCWEEALELFRSIGAASGSRRSAAQLRRTPSTYLHILLAVTQSQQCDVALGLLNDAAEEAIRLEPRAYRAVAQACAEQGRWQDVEAMMLGSESTMARVNVTPDALTYVALMEAYRRAGMAPDRVVSVMDMMREAGFEPGPEALAEAALAHADSTDWPAAEAAAAAAAAAAGADAVVAYNALLSACAKAGLTERALSYLSFMKQAGVRPDVMSYNLVLRAFSGAPPLEDKGAAARAAAELSAL